jgi:hypothetical protein
MTAMRDRDLDELLKRAAQARPLPSPGLMDRVLADALAEQGQIAPQASPIAAITPRPGWISRLAGAFGGGPALAGVCSFLVVGVAVGYLNPTAFDYLIGGMAGAETVDLFPTADFLMTEG